MSGFSLRPAQEGDLPALLALYRDYHKELESFGMPYALREEELERVLRLRIRSRLILTELALDGDGAPAGFVFCSILRLANEYLCQGSASVGYLNDLYVSPALRRRGAARALTARAEDWLREQGVPTIQLQVLRGNPATRTYWEGVGMRAVGTLYDKNLEKEGT